MTDDNTMHDDVTKDEVADALAEEKKEEHADAAPKEDYKASYLRAMADYQNLQKEMQTQRSEWARLSEAQVIEEFLPVYDNFKKAFAHKPAHGEDKQWQSWASGIGFIMQQFLGILKAHDIEEMSTVGQQFDPTKHDTVGEEPSDKPAGTIVREVDGGYLLKGKVMKVAKVIVSGGEQQS